MDVRLGGGRTFLAGADGWREPSLTQFRTAAGSRRSLVAGAIAVAIMLAGCGSEPSDEDQVRAVVADVRRAFEANDVAALCDITTKDAQRHVGYAGHQPPEGCARDMRQFVAMVRKSTGGEGPAEPTVERVTIRGDRATAVVDAGEGALARLPLVREGGTWKLDALYGGMPAGRQEDKF